MSDLEQALKQVKVFKQEKLKGRFGEIEKQLEGCNSSQIGSVCTKHNVDFTLLQAAQAIKKAAAQIDEVVHGVGILILLSKILQPGEIVKLSSLGAGNTGKAFDLETNLRIAEFKFINWKGGPESIRQNGIFKDFFYLAEAVTTKKRFLYVLGKEKPVKFLEGGRAINSVLKEKKLNEDYKANYGERFEYVREYYNYRKDLVDIIDIYDIEPTFLYLEE